MRGATAENWLLCDNVAISTPVVQAPLGPYDGPRLAAEVSRAGGLGCLSLFDQSPAAARRLLERVHRRTRRPILVALTRQWEPESVLDTCLAHDARLFQVFWWNGPRLSPRIHAGGGKVFWQVGTVEQARDAAQCGADVLVAQGTEAGGQVRGGTPLEELLPQVRAATGLPVIAGGGLADADDVQRVLDRGARAAMLGTRFVASEEALAPASYKARLVRAQPEDLYLDPRLVGDWPCAPRRRIRSLLGEDAPRLYAGLGVGRIRSLLSAAEIVRRLSLSAKTAERGAALRAPLRR